MLPLHPQLSPHGTQFGYSLEDTLRELLQERGRATVASLPKAYPTKLQRAASTGEESVVNAKKTYLLKTSSNGKNLNYCGDERSDTDEDNRDKRYCQKKRGEQEFRAENLNKRGIVTVLTEMEAILILSVTRSLTERKTGPLFAERKPDEYRKEIKIPTGTVSMGTCPSPYWNIWTSSVVAVTSVRMMRIVARENAGASFG